MIRGVYGGEPDQLNTAPWAAALNFGKRVEEIDPAVMEGLHTRFMYDHDETTMEIAARAEGYMLALRLLLVRSSMT